jgi:parallel beta-helix repeat protein
MIYQIVQRELPESHNRECGVYFSSDTSYNILSNNIVCSNPTDIYIYDADSNSGDENMCNTTYNWNDDGTTGCTNACPGSITTCDSCEDCTNKLDGSYNMVMLTTDITNQWGDYCIIFGSSNVVFDGDGHKIDGDYFETGYGIYMSGKSGNTVKNCVVTDFYNGIYLTGSSGNTIIGNTANSNRGDGVYLYDSSGNTISNNEANLNSCAGIDLIYDSSGNTISNNEANLNNRYGIYLSDSSGNTITNNEANSNNRYGISFNSLDSNNNTLSKNVVCFNPTDIYDVDTNSGDGNTCNTTYNWNDAGTKTGCTNKCSSTITCDSCKDCSDKLNGIYDTVILTTDIIDHSGTCIIFGASNIMFDGNGHKIDGDDSVSCGILSSGNDGISVKNCVVTDFYYGICLTDSSGNSTICGNTANSNIWSGIDLDSSSGSRTVNNEASLNLMYGILLSSSSTNQVENNDVNSNVVGVCLYKSSGNTIVRNEASSNQRGIFLSYSSDNQVSKNDASSNSHGGIDLLNSASNEIRSNDVLNNNNSHVCGIKLYGSDSNTVSGNEIINNYYGIKFDDSHYNKINSNKVCSNPGPDFDLFWGGSSHNSGDHNTCDEPGGTCDKPDWNDAGTTGCTYRCTPKKIPVLFVHGGCFTGSGCTAVWEDIQAFLRDNGYKEQDLFTIELDPGRSANGDIKVYAERLSSKIADVKSRTCATKVDLVCHSMGGLVSRWYTTHGYNDDVRKLIMLGTPNHGSELMHVAHATLLIHIFPGFPLGVPVEIALGTGFRQMTPHSPFLNTLNYGACYRLTGTDSINTAIHHEVIAGTEGWWYTTLILWGDDDGLVRVESARLDDVNLQTVPYDHFDMPLRYDVCKKVLSILQDDSAISQQSLESIQAQQTPPTPLQEAPVVFDTIDSGEERSHDISISSTSEVGFILAWREGDLNLTLTTPDGTFINPSFVANDGNVTYYSDENLTIEGYAIKNPQSGIWKINVTAVNISGEQDYIIMTFLDTNTTLSLSLPGKAHTIGYPSIWNIAGSHHRLP